MYYTSLFCRMMVVLKAQYKSTNLKQLRILALAKIH